MLKRYQERDDVQKRCLIDCVNEDEATTDVDTNVSEEEHDDSVEVEDSVRLAANEMSELIVAPSMLSSPTKSPAKSRKRSARTATSPAKQSPPNPVQTNTPATSLLEYVVDQKGVGSESLVVKSANIGKNSGQCSASSGSRRNSLVGIEQSTAKNGGLLMPKRGYSQRSLFNPNQQQQQRPLNQYQNSQLTTQSHQLFPNYPQTDISQYNHNQQQQQHHMLPNLDAQFDFNLMMNSDLGLTALNANDFNLLGVWNNNSNPNRSYFDLVQQMNQQQAAYDVPRYMNQPLTAAISANSQNPINSLVSDLFGDISGMF